MTATYIYKSRLNNISDRSIGTMSMLDLLFVLPIIRHFCCSTKYCYLHDRRFQKHEIFKKYLSFFNHLNCSVWLVWWSDSIDIDKKNSIQTWAHLSMRWLSSETDEQSCGVLGECKHTDLACTILQRTDLACIIF